MTDWHDTKQEVPADDRPVLSYGNGIFEVVKYRKDHFVAWPSGLAPSRYITHWTELPPEPGKFAVVKPLGRS